MNKNLTYLHFFIMPLILLIVINYTLSSYCNKYDIFNYINNSKVKQFILTLLSLYSLYLLFNRNTFLPFLGETVLPSKLLCNNSNNNNIINNNNLIHLKINTDNDTDKIIWWAADNDNSNIVIDNPNDAYKKYNNSGISLVNNNIAEVVLLCPKSYIAGGRELPKHLHYRESKKDILGDVKTININCNHNEH
jgi:hypothetical protein